MALTPWVPEVFVIFHKKSSSPSFLPCSSDSSRCSFVISFTLALAWFLISAFSLWYFSTSCSTLWNSLEEMSPSCITCQIILVILSNLLRASSLMAPCFFSLYREDFKRLSCNFHVIAVARERSRLVPLKAISTGNQTPLANAAILIPAVITVDVIRPVSTMPVIKLNRFIFFYNLFTNLIVRKFKKICLNFTQLV